MLRIIFTNIKPFPYIVGSLSLAMTCPELILLFLRLLVKVNFKNFFLLIHSV